MPDSDESMQPAICSDSHEEVEQTRIGNSKRRKGHRDKLWRWSPEDDARLLSMTENHRPWPEIEGCFPERTESALRQRQSVLRRTKKQTRLAEPAAAVTSALTAVT
ncbi:hypothetical protein RJZ56_008199 [Blastomyces dermatitidis]|uniref:Myb-like domain-containing protein n=3 Tax=Blastomyces TaxID=229219 RepID=A0A179UZD4_BLAGS|nr:uncharacterized protein BDBG_08459 [Blastomyces gilchristii SLH14081]XP_045282881.1 uncharacterized protein BDCG_17952 [Blastomyces dermatitidis ER-3]EGE83195.1 hypothetical protein BDDG_06139 [Blastomyces dermatitidis ATCC 18188]EQL29541.1 hypothetical protein BDFG_07848 [Blastomyces dermatitidis ATCC 26199]OAT03154.1 hypothetical protein BDCG_17952 [Blastomyces dermatitidis ER-3]OAT13210.1 hypothetical protein BDBG_08459 [Blastomyces gilchristii SLH14081]